MEIHKIINIFENATSMAGYESNTANLCKMAAKVCEYNFIWQYFTLFIIVPSVHTASLEVFFRNYQRGVSVATLDGLATASRAVTQYVIVSHDTFDVTNILTQLMKLNYDTTGKYVIICSSKQCDKKSIFSLLSKYSIFNVLFLKYVDQNPAVFNYIPIIPGNCNNAEPRRLHQIHMGCKNDDCFKKLLPIELSDMLQCPFVAGGFDKHPLMTVSGPNSPS